MICATQRLVNTCCRKLYSTIPNVKFEHLILSNPAAFVTHVQLNRPEKRNALNTKLWLEIGTCFEHLSANSDCRCIVLSGAGKVFCAGIDLMDMMEMFKNQNSSNVDCIARKSLSLKTTIQKYQAAFTAIEKCEKPVIAAVHGACLGGAMALLSATDVRYSTSDALFQIKEVLLGFAADVGQLQRMSKLLGTESLLRELAFTGRMFTGAEALKMGFVSRTFDSNDDVLHAALTVATDIASKSPVATRVTKANLNFSRDHTVDESLEHMALWNMSMLQSEDVLKATMAVAAKQEEPVEFEKL